MSDETLTECLMFVAIAIVTVGMFTAIICGKVDP